MSTNNHKEKISAFLDSEIHHEEIMSFSLSSEFEDADLVRRYQLIGDALRGEVTEASFVDVSRSVHTALQGESLAKESKQAAGTTNRIPAGNFSLSTWFRPVTGMAVAASVALVMVVTLTGQEGPSPSPVATNIAPLPVAKSVPEMRLAEESKPVDKASRGLDPQLVNRHLEFATRDALQGRLPYVRAVSYQKKQ